jgi:hypothetical protein
MRPEPRSTRRARRSQAGAGPVRQTDLRRVAAGDPLNERTRTMQASSGIQSASDRMLLHVALEKVHLDLGNRSRLLWGGVRHFDERNRMKRPTPACDADATGAGSHRSPPRSHPRMSMRNEPFECLVSDRKKS